MGVGALGGGRSVLPTPHLTYPLEGGRDELGKRAGVGSVGCPRWVRGRVGMVERGAGE